MQRRPSRSASNAGRPLLQRFDIAPRHLLELSSLVGLASLLILVGCQSLPEQRAASAFEHPGWKHWRAADGQEYRYNQRQHALQPRLEAPGEWTEFQIERRVPAGEIAVPMNALSKARQQRDRMPLFSSQRSQWLSPKASAESKAAAQWEWLGPANIAGRGRTLAFDPRDANRMFTAGVSGGVWLSEDRGQNWQPVSDGAENINIGSLLIDPVEPDTLYAGTGELYRNSERPYSAMWGQGILRSRDGGRSFQQLLATANDDFRYVADLAISPNDHRRLYAATNSGVWLSRDSGATFERLLRPGDEADQLRYEGCNDLLILPGGPEDRVIASCSSRSVGDRYWLPNSVTPAACVSPCPAAIYRNLNAAGNGEWTQVLSEFGMGRTTVAMAPSNPSILYAVSASIAPGFDRNGDAAGDYENGLHAVFRSDDGGLNWQARVRNSSSDALSTYLFSYADGMEAPRCGFGNFNNYSAGWYNQAIAVDPVNPDILWVAGMDIYRSDDGGLSFGKASYWYLNGETPAGVHADVHHLQFDPGYDAGGNQRLWVVTDGGIFLSDSARGAISNGIGAACGPSNGVIGWQASSNGLGTVQYYSGAISADGSRYIAGAQDNGTHLNDYGNGVAGWRHIFGGDGAEVAMDPNNAQRFFVSYQGVTIHRTQNGGNSFVPATNGLNDTPIFIMPYVLDRNQPNRLWAGATRVWTSDDSGASWQRASRSFGASFDDRVSAIAVAPSNSNRVLAANRRGIFRNDAAQSAGSTTTWHSVSPRPGWVSSLTFRADNDQIVYATYSSFGGDHVWKSGDGGSSWQPIDGSGSSRLPDIAVHSLAIDPGDPRRLYAGTDLGIYVSLDDGAHWAAENSGFASVIVERLATSPGLNGQPPMLYAFTYGRGAWRVPLSQLSGQSDYRIDEAVSGSFYDPQTDGQGWVLESLELDGVRWVAASWYSYRDGQQLWLLGAAPANGSRVSIPLSLYSGGQFNPNFDPAAVQSQDWGLLELEFADADHVSAQWNSLLGGFADGSANLIRLTQPGGSNQTSQLSACHSGSWFKPSESGHGLQVEVFADGSGGQQMFAVWYHYFNGQPIWLLGVGAVDGDHADLAMELTQGTGFPPDFNSSEVQRIPWGSLRFSVSGADSAAISWQSAVEGYGSGSLNLQRLTRLAGHACTGN